MIAQRALLASALSCLVLLVACGDSTGPADLGDLDPAGLNAALLDLVSPLSAGRTVSENLARAYPDLESAGVEFHREQLGFRSGALRRSLIAPARPPSAVTFPEGVAGRTFVYDEATGQWGIDESRDDAPADGVRVDWYQLDGADEIILPPAVEGHADLTPTTHSGMEAMRVRAVETLGGGTSVLMDFEQAAEVTEATEWSEVIRMAGSYSDGSSTAEFSLSSDASGDSETGAQEYEMTSLLEATDIRYEMVATGHEDAQGIYEDDFRAEAVWEGSTTVLELTFTGQDNSQEASGRLLHDGAHLADVSVEGSLYTFTAPDGAEFAAEQTTALNDLFRTMLLAGLQPLVRLPLAFL